MPVTDIWENEPRDERGRWTEGGGSGADTSDGGGLGRLKGNLVANAGPLLEGVRGGARSKMFSQGDILATQHMDGAAKLLHSWNQGADWSDGAFRDNFFSPMHKLDFATGMRQAAQRLAVADNDGDKCSAARDLGWGIGRYGPMEWVKDVPALQKRADAALDPRAPSLGLEGFHSVKQATNFEYAGLRAEVTGKDGPPVFERAAKGMDGKPLVPDLAKRPALCSKRHHHPVPLPRLADYTAGSPFCGRRQPRWGNLTSYRLCGISGRNCPA